MAKVAYSLTQNGRIDYLVGTPRAQIIDRWIYVFMAVVFIVVALAGFIPDSVDKIAEVTAGKRPPFPLVLHLHAALMGSFLLLLLTQSWLVAVGKNGAHAKIGVASLLIVPALMIVGFILVPTIFQETLLASQTASPVIKEKLAAALTRKENVLLIQIRMGLLFPLLIGVALHARRTDPGFHKRMMVLATASVLIPAIVRIHWLPTTLPASPVATDLYMLLTIAPMLVWDLIRNRYVHWAYIVWGSISLPLLLATYILWDTQRWHLIARSILT